MLGHFDQEKFKDAIDSMLGVTKFPSIAVQKKAKSRFCFRRLVHSS